MALKYISISLCMLMLSIAGFGQTKKTEKKPGKYLAKVVHSGKSNYDYYALSQTNRTTYTVYGPGKLHINFRVRLEGNSFSTKPTRVIYKQSGKYVNSFEVPALMAGNLKYKSTSVKGSPSKKHSVVIEVPPGKHHYSFYKTDNEQKVHIRAFYEKYPKPEWKDVAPLKPLTTRDVRFIKSGKTRKYYHISKKESFTFCNSDTVGLRFIVRPEFSNKMLDETILRVRVENLTTGKTSTYKFTARRSSKMEFVTDQTHIPGTSSTFYVNLPRPFFEEDQYKVTLVSGAKGAVIRISRNATIPECSGS